MIQELAEHLLDFVFEAPTYGGKWARGLLIFFVMVLAWTGLFLLVFLP